MLSSKHVVLGLLNERPGYGYDLQKRIDQRFGFLELSDNFVYRTLDRLEEAGLIEPVGPKEFGQTRRGAPRVTYVLTEAGRAEFRDWMSQPISRTQVRDELQGKLALSEPADFPQLIEATYAVEREYVADLRALARPPLHEVSDGPMPWKEVASVLIDDATATRLQGAIEWLQRVRAVIRRRAELAARPG